MLCASQEKQLKELRQKLEAADSALQNREVQAVQLEATLDQLKKEKVGYLIIGYYNKQF